MMSWTQLQAAVVPAVKALKRWIPVRLLNMSSFAKISDATAAVPSTILQVSPAIHAAKTVVLSLVAVIALGMMAVSFQDGVTIPQPRTS